MPRHPANDSPRATTLRSPRALSRSASFLDGYRDSTLGVFALLLAFRIVNALTLRTFFQPDEFFQSLEPAWQLAFGQTSGAWVTWEWRTQLRSSLHPEIFASVYLVAAKVSRLCGLGAPNEAQLLIAAPKVTQAVFAALLDYYTWKLSEKVHGRGSRTAFTTLALSLCSPWQWFCSTRTLSNCLETTISSIAVYYWPWHWPAAETGSESHRQDSTQIATPDPLGSLLRLRLSLLLAACACILRPTNVLIWLPVSIPTLWTASSRGRYVLVREILVCGSAVLACSVLSDRLYYQAWTLPPLRFLYFNIAQSLAVFYGRNRPDYYVTEGLPLLLTTALPFAVVGTWQALRGHHDGHEALDSARAPSSPSPSSSTPRTSPPKETDTAPSPGGTTPSKDTTSIATTTTPSPTISTRITTRLSYSTLLLPLTLSLISHKEVRFLYPILPFLHLLASRPLTTFFTPSTSPLTPFPRKLLLLTLLSTNLFLGLYTTQVHQRGVLDVLTHIRQSHELKLKLQNMNANSNANVESVKTTVAFLMPCHSTPWRSHLVHPGISAWALTCEPPLNISLDKRGEYLDEADEFYISPGPEEWLRGNMVHVDSIKAVASGGGGAGGGSRGSRSAQHWDRLRPELLQGGRRAWPDHLVFFAQLEGTMGRVLEGTRYRECWRGFNSQWHDDWRRVGDVVVWCLDGSRAGGGGK